MVQDRYTVTMEDNYYCFTDLCLGLPGWASTRRNIHPLTPILIINHPLPASSIYCDPRNPLCSIYVPSSLFAQSLSKFSLVYLLVWHPPFHTPYISSPNHCFYDGRLTGNHFMSYQMVQISATLSELEGHFCCYDWQSLCICRASCLFLISVTAWSFI